MATTIGHACHDENNKYSGGTAGDQTGGEVTTRTWYNRPWTVVLRPNSTTVANKLVTAMKAACANNKIGYDQNQRNTILTQAKKYNYDLSKITVACECDCSSLVSVCCVYAGISLSVVYSGSNLCTTSTLQSALKGTGKFTVLTASKYLTSSDYLKPGDILLYPGHHVAINLTTGSKVSTKSTYTGTFPSKTLRKGNTGTQVGYLQKFLNWYGSYGLDVDNDFGSKTQSAVKNFQKAEGLDDDGIFGPKSLAKAKTVTK